jgi:hypothetical protein
VGVTCMCSLSHYLGTLAWSRLSDVYFFPSFNFIKYGKFCPLMAVCVHPHTNLFPGHARVALLGSPRDSQLPCWDRWAKAPGVAIVKVLMECDPEQEEILPTTQPDMSPSCFPPFQFL